MPHHREIVDELCFVRGLTTDVFNHGPAKLFMNTGFGQFGRPSMGSWISYGIGSEASDLPGFVVLQSGSRGAARRAAAVGQRFPADPTTRECRSDRGRADPASEPARRASTREQQRDFFDAVGAIEPLRRSARCERPRDRHPDRRLRDGVSHADQRARTDGSVAGDAGGARSTMASRAGKPSFANNCLLARRRLVERGVRFVQLYHTELGPPRRPRRQPRPAARGALSRGRPGVGGTGARPQTPRPARRHAGHLGRRVRPHPDGRGAASRSAAITTSTPSPCGWPAAASSPASPTE